MFLLQVSGRLRFNIVSSHWEEQLGKVLFQQQLEKYHDKLFPETSEEHHTVKRILDRLIPHSGLADAEWDINVVNSPELSAFVIPGGKVFVHHGLLDLCTREDELAVVLGHEISHHVAHHMSESISRYLIWIPIYLISCLTTGMDPDLVELGVDVAFYLPGSRNQEREADYMGLLIAAESGYDPAAALDLWARWERVDKDEVQAPRFLRTHPSHHSRLDQINGWLVNARKNRLLGASHDEGFQGCYYLQRTFCGTGREFETSGAPGEVPKLGKSPLSSISSGWTHMHYVENDSQWPRAGLVTAISYLV